MLAPVRTVAPATTPVSLVEAKAHLRVDHEDDDTLIEGFIAAATDHLDGWTGILGRCLVEQEWRQDFDAFARGLCLPLGSVISVTTVTWRNTAGQVSTVEGIWYSLQIDAGGRYFVRFRDDYAFPGDLYERGAVSVAYKAGYATVPEVPANGDDPAIPAKSTVPAALKVAILLLVGNWYANRETMVVGATVESLPFAVDALIAPFRRVGV
ncbi:hypothetical protein ASD64_08965 [Mesorhizobium sp. Root157]|uniref:head-tail connector protein n=1 Tax=Mesorhizobium sp. Root157 TaxID=1736477 RepID=UPI0006F758CF|nr:head-tail connector protein [Mesorhizobium sp. Root157]KQZ81879.1 hypothetical protein ASD64_08965 [Mesorhizobium sp. Root157]